MKLEKLFDSRDNTLFDLNGTEINLSNCPVIDAKDFCEKKSGEDKVTAITVKWSYSGFDEENYNEEFLALFRDRLKELEETSKFAFIVPAADSDCTDEIKKQAFADSMNHCARRIKDCTSVIGFSIPDECNASDFMELLLKKHQHYVFFSKNETVLNDKSIVRF
ncbi:MAG: hypothetical protein J6O39_05900 [Treponema sp.]|nr:hypothetical protein [Treponema sp.]